MISRTTLGLRSEAAEDRSPLLMIDEFFDGNRDEESLAPNQWGFGRPAPAEIAERLRLLEGRAEVAWIRVELHPEWGEEFGDAPAAESIAICTGLSPESVEALLDTASLQSDGVMVGFTSPEEDLCDIPPIPAGARVLSVVWD